jgi:hypothetical protein
MAIVTPPAYFAGIDLGQRRDYTALCVVEKSTLISDDRNPVTWEFIRYELVHVTHLDRFPLGTPYPAISDSIAALVNNTLAPRQDIRSDVVVALDATGVGLPVYDLLKARPRFRAFLAGVCITSGTKPTRDGLITHIPRRMLLSKLHTLAVQRAFSVSSKLRHARTLLHEFSNLRVHFEGDRVRSVSEATITPEKSTQHDDLVFATALALWFANTHGIHSAPESGPLPGLHPWTARRP